MYTPGQLTHDLASRNREALVSRLTHYDPDNTVSTADLALVNSSSTEMTLQKLMTLSRPEIYQNPEVYNIEERLGISRPGSRRHKALTLSKTRSEPAYRKPLGKGDSAQRWFKGGGGFMTASHQGRCSLDPKLISVNSPGAGRPGLTQSKKTVPGMGFSASTSSRGLDPIKVKKQSDRPVTVQEPVIRRMGGPENMISTGARYGPIQWQSTELRKGGMTASMSVHAGASVDFSRNSPGPAYNSAQSNKAACKTQGGIGFAKTTRFHQGMNSHVPPSSSPGPIYAPTLTQTAKALPITHHFSGRLKHGSTYEVQSNICSPGPVYNPRDVANHYTDTAPAHQFGFSPEQQSERQRAIDARESGISSIKFGGPAGAGGRGKRGQRRRNQRRGGGAAFEAMRAELSRSLESQKGAKHRELLYM